MRIDAHQHCRSARAYDPERIERILRRNRFDGMVVAPVEDSLEETRLLLELAARHPMILGVVGRVELTGAVLDELGKWPAFRAVRAAGGGMEGLREAAARGLSVELPAASVEEAAERVDGLRMVIPQMGFEGGDFDSWAKRMERLAAVPGVYVKISGPAMPAASLRPLVQHLMRVFGPRRLMFGSDWPLCLDVVDTWKKVLAAFTQAMGAQTVETRSWLLGETAMEAYRIASGPPAPDCSPDGE